MQLDGTYKRIETMAFDLYSRGNFEIIQQIAKDCGFAEFSNGEARQCIKDAIEHIKSPAINISSERELFSVLDAALLSEVKKRAAYEILNPAFYGATDYSVHEGCDL